MILRSTHMRAALRARQSGFILNPFAFGAGGPSEAGVISPFYPTTLYSLRLRKSGYSGACIRLRRMSDSAEQDIGFGSDGYVDQGAITSFLGSSDGGVATWYDQSGGGVHLTTTGGSRPLIATAGVVETLDGKAAIKFPSATNPGMSVAANAAFAFGTAAFTWEVHSATDSIDASGDCLIDFSGGSSVAALFYNQNGTTPTVFDGANLGVAGTVVSTSTRDQAVSYVGGASSAMRIFTGGSVSSNTNQTLSFGGNRPLNVNARSGGTQQRFGRYQEIIITKGACQYTAAYTPRAY